MTFSRVVLWAMLAAVSAPAQESANMREARLRFNDVEARAVANFRSADSLEYRLRAEGYTLHPRLIALRIRIGNALDAAKAALAHGEMEPAGQATLRAEALVARFAREMGGD